MKDSPILKMFRQKVDLGEFKFYDEEMEENSEKKNGKGNTFEDMGKWWHAPKNGPDMNNPEPQN